MGLLVLLILFFAGFPMVCALMAVAYDVKNPTPKGYYRHEQSRAGVAV